MKETIFTGAAVALVTPFNPDMSVNYEELEKLIEFQITSGTDAIVTCGTTGEAATLTDEEHVKVIEFTVNKVAGRVPVIAGTGSNDTAYAVELSQKAEALGANGLLLVTPYYNKANQAGLVAHYAAITAAVPLPLLAYHVPGRTGCRLTPETCLTLSRAAPASTFCRKRTTSSRRRRTSLPQRKRTTTFPRSSKRVSFAVMTSRFTPVKTRRLCRSRLSAARASSLRSPTSCRKKCTSLPPLPLRATSRRRRHSRLSISTS